MMDRVWETLYRTWQEDPGTISEDLLRECYLLQDHTQYESDRAPVVARLESMVVAAVDKALAAEKESSR